MTDVEDQYLAYIVTMMHKVGLWPETWLEYMRGLFLLVNLFLLLIMGIADMDPSDIQEFTITGAVLVNVVVLMVKALVLMTYEGRGKWMVNDVRERCKLLEAEFPEHSALLQNREKNIRKITKGLLVTLFSVFSCWVSVPLLSVIGILPGTNVNLPMKVRYPLDLNNCKNLAVAFLHEISCMMLGIPTYVMSNMIYIGFISFTCGQLRVLSLGLQSLDSKNSHEKLGFCINMHSSILAFGKELASLMSRFLLIEFAACIAVICQCLIQLSTESLASEHTIKFVSYLAMLLVEVWLYCYFGNQLVDYSTEVQTAAYNCPWYNMENTKAKSLSLVILRSQSPLRLTIGKMYVLSLETFTEVLKFCYSVYTLLREVDNGRQNV